MTVKGVMTVTYAAVTAGKGLSALSNGEKVEVLRSRMAHLVSVPRSVSPVEEPRALPLQGPLGELTALGGLPRGAATSMTDCPTVLVQIIAQASAAGEHVAVVGRNDMFWAAVADAGGDLSFVSIIELPDVTSDVANNLPDPLSVLGVLCEGMDLVVYCGHCWVDVPPSSVRPVMSRVRSSRCALLVCGVRWPGVSLRIDATVSAFRGLGCGQGRIRGMSVDVQVADRYRPPRRGQWHMGVGSFIHPVRHHCPAVHRHSYSEGDTHGAKAVEAGG
ncbi:hypothetical protein ACGE24_05190 [Corynebacterium kroppenstedtii]|uniref:hypothetical protein n=1 Tax=Corynebacterium sp. PCR 32 TaxID=3351342 RepID=UPI0030B5268D